MFSSPNSFSMTAIFWPCASVSTRLSSVVLPEPRKPVRMVAGMRLMGAVLSCRGEWGPICQDGADRPTLSRYRRCVNSRKGCAARLLRPSSNSPPAARCPNPSRPFRGGDKHAAAPAERRTLFQKLIELVAPGPDSRDQLIESLADAEHKELIEPESRMMLEGVIRMADMTAGDVMVAAPRMDLLDIDAAYDELLHVVIDTAHSRFPVYEGERENIIGILMAKDLLKLQRSPDLNLRTLLRPAVFVPESKGLNDLLRDFRSNRNHLAIVIDEFGHTAGPDHDRGRARGDRRRDRGRVRRQGRRRGRHLRPGGPHLPRQRRHRDRARSTRPSACCCPTTSSTPSAA